MKPIIQNIELSYHIGQGRRWVGEGASEKALPPFSAIKITDNRILLQTAGIQID